MLVALWLLDGRPGRWSRARGERLPAARDHRAERLTALATWLRGVGRAGCLYADFEEVCAMSIAVWIGTRATMRVPRPGTECSSRCPFSSAARSCMLTSPRPAGVVAF